MVIFYNFPPTASHLHPLQVENCDSNSRLVVDEDENGLKRLSGVVLRAGTTMACLYALRSASLNHGPVVVFTWRPRGLRA